MKNTFYALLLILLPTLAFGQAVTTFPTTGRPTDTLLDKGNFRLVGKVIFNAYAAAGGDTVVLCAGADGRMIAISKTLFGGSGSGVDTLAYIRKDDTATYSATNAGLYNASATLQTNIDTAAFNIYTYVATLGVDTLAYQRKDDTLTYSGTKADLNDSCDAIRHGLTFDQSIANNPVTALTAQFIGAGGIKVEVSPYNISQYDHTGTNAVTTHAPYVLSGPVDAELPHVDGIYLTTGDTVYGQGASIATKADLNLLLSPDLSTVTAAGNTTTDSIVIQSGSFPTNVLGINRADAIYSKGGTGNMFYYLGSNKMSLFKTSSISGTITCNSAASVVDTIVRGGQIVTTLDSLGFLLTVKRGNDSVQAQTLDRVLARGSSSARTFSLTNSTFTNTFSGAGTTIANSSTGETFGTTPQFIWFKQTGSAFQLNIKPPAAITANRNQFAQDDDGTVALTKNIPTMTTLTASGTGVATSFTFTIPSGFTMPICQSQNAVAVVASSSISGTTLTINTVAAPVVGTNNLVFTVFYK